MASEPRNAGIDIIKAISIVLVLIWHIQPVTKEMLPSNSQTALWCNEALNFFYINLTLLAVPAFILVSLYLFINKVSQIENYWKQRLVRLIQVFLFWVCIQFILYLLLGGKLPLPLKTIIPGGGPDLPSGPSIFYYLFILILCTVWTLLFLKLPEKFKLILSIVIIVLSCLHFFFSSRYGIGIGTRAMESYYIYIPVAYYLQKYKDKFVQYRMFFFFGFFLSVFTEHTFNGTISAYGRLSVFFGVLSFVSLFISGWSTANRPIRFLSKYSLGIFALHPYFLYLSRNLYTGLPHQGGQPSVGLLIESTLLFSTTVILTFLFTYLLGKTKLRSYIS
jgi:hypothetical protein